MFVERAFGVVLEAGGAGVSPRAGLKSLRDAAHTRVVDGRFESSGRGARLRLRDKGGRARPRSSGPRGFRREYKTWPVLRIRLWRSKRRRPRAQSHAPGRAVAAEGGGTSRLRWGAGGGRGGPAARCVGTR